MNWALAAHVTRARLRRRKDVSSGTRVTHEQRHAWADAIRQLVRSHPKAWAAVSSTHRRIALPGNRRAAKTTSVGHEILARLVENDHHISWVFVDHLAEFTRNWVARGFAPGADPAKAPQTGMLQQLELYGIPYSYQRYDEKKYYGVSFPLWGSRLEIHPAEHTSQVDAARGGACHDLWLDEAQKMPQILHILEDVGGPAGKDFRAQFFMTGTPGVEVGSFFHRVVAGDNPDWEVHDITSADNPFYGDSWDERFERSILADIRETRHTNNLTGDQLANLSALTEETFTVPRLEEMGWVHKLPNAIRREALRMWVAPSVEMIYPQDHIPVDVRYWADWAPAVTPAAIGLDVKVVDVVAQADGWTERFHQLPKRRRPNGRLEARMWQAVICQDLGCDPDPMAITLQVWAPHEALYEFDTAKIRGLRGDEMLEVLREWVLAAKKLPYIKLWGVVVDDDGGATPSMVDDWRHKLVPHLPVVGILDAYKPKRDLQVALLNAERAGGGVRVLRHGPIDIEEQHLRREPWDPERPGKNRDQDKHRLVNVAVLDSLGRKATLQVRPGNDALDARRYGWWRSTRNMGTMSEPKSKPPRMSEGEWQEQQIQLHQGGKRKW